MTTEGQKRLHDIRLAAETIGRFASGKFISGFKGDELLQTAVERKLGIIGEAFVKLDQEAPATAERFPELRQIVGMRNRLVHGYDTLDLDVLWDTVVNEVPKLLEHTNRVLLEEDGLGLADGAHRA
jgi:uncharacterized protein with HEPN domain